MSNKQKTIIIVCVIVILLLLLWAFAGNRQQTLSPDDTSSGGSSSNNSGSSAGTVTPGKVNKSTYNQCGCSPALNKVTQARIEAETTLNNSMRDALLRQADAINKLYGGV